MHIEAIYNNLLATNISRLGPFKKLTARGICGNCVSLWGPPHVANTQLYNWNLVRGKKSHLSASSHPSPPGVCVCWANSWRSEFPPTVFQQFIQLHRTEDLCHRLQYVSLIRWGFFCRKPLAAGSHDWPPAPLGWKLAYAWNTITVENNRNWAKLLLHDVYFHSQWDPQIHNNHGCKTTICWFSWTCNESK